MHDQNKFGDHWSTGWQGEFGSTWELYKLVSAVVISWWDSFLTCANSPKSHGTWLLACAWFAFKCWHTAEALQAILLSCKHFSLNIYLLSESEQIEDLKPQGNWPRKVPCYGQYAGDSNRAPLWCSLSTGAVKADVLCSCVNCGSFWPSELQAGLSES